MLKQEAQTAKERLFICPCSKSYFSYAALFTHVKQKHDGKPPGAIIKPNSENKRGRPRKQPELKQTPSEDFSKVKIESMGGEDSSGVLNSNSKMNQTIFDLKSSRQSQFKAFKKDSCSNPSTYQLPMQKYFQVDLLKDLSRYLQIRQLTHVPDSLILEIQASKYLLQDNQTQSKMIQNFKIFLSLCKNVLWEQTYSQILLLLSMLLQHILESNKNKKLQLKMIHEHIVSFFDYINQTSQLMDLSQFSIFNDLNTIKTLIVFFNWLGKGNRQASYKLKDGEELSQ